MAVFAYLVGCEKTKEALVIDPAGDEDRIPPGGEQKGPEDKIQPHVRVSKKDARREGISAAF